MSTYDVNGGSSRLYMNHVCHSKHSKTTVTVFALSYFVCTAVYLCGQYSASDGSSILEIRAVATVGGLDLVQLYGIYIYIVYCRTCIPCASLDAIAFVFQILHPGEGREHENY